MHEEMAWILVEREGTYPTMNSTLSFPTANLHGPSIVELLVHLERVPQQVRLVAPALLQALVLGTVEVVL